MRSRSAALLAAGLICVVSTTYLACAEDKEGKEGKEDQAALARALQGVTTTLEQGLAASEGSGTPISGKFELEAGKLQLSVYTMKGDQFAEVVVDHTTGRVAKTEAITGGDDLAAAKSQSAAVSTAKRTLREATEHAVGSNAGSRAVSVIAARVGDGNSPPVARITLLQGQTFKIVTEPLN